MKIAIASTFTSEPIQEALQYFLEPLEPEITFAPYNQVFQELLNLKNEGLALYLVRLEDWFRELEREPIGDEVKKVADDFFEALKTAQQNRKFPLLLAFCPHAPNPLYDTLQKDLIEKIETLEGVSILDEKDLKMASIESPFDEYQNRIGHIPYTRLYFTYLAMLLSRRLYALLYPPKKVIVVDCDQTLWKGVVGEEGPQEVEPYVDFQNQLVEQMGKGKLLALCTKNIEKDIWDVFRQHPEMPLKRENIVAYRINWKSKTENITSLCKDLNVGTDSTIFIDDNPIECAEVGLTLPEVFVVNLPSEKELHKPFFDNHWIFDQMKVTAEDRKRTQMVREENARQEVKLKTSSFEEFLEQLNLRVDIEKLSQEEIPRASQLTIRTNQFNATTHRYSEKDIQSFIEQGKTVLRVRVEDRFGSYGLVGLMICYPEKERWIVDTFLLSCRVLGKRVENEMIKALAKMAGKEGKSALELQYQASERNAPLRQFYESLIGRSLKTQQENIPIPLHDVEKNLPTIPPEYCLEEVKKRENPLTTQSSKLFQEIAECYGDPHKLLAKVKEKNRKKSPPLSKGGKILNPIQQQVADIWKDTLNLENVGLSDDFFKLGGSSLIATEILGEIYRKFKIELPLHVFLEEPTVEKLSQRISNPPVNEYQFLVPLGLQNPTHPPLFIFPGMFGQLFILRPLAEKLSQKFRCLGFKARGVDDGLEPEEDIYEMAKSYRKEMEKLQPNGPYSFLGYCSGGFLALEIASQLVKEGKQAPFIAMVDTRLPSSYYPPLTSQDRWEIHRYLFRKKGYKYLFEWLSNRFRWEMGKIKKIFGQDPRKTKGDLRAWPVADAFMKAEKKYQVPHYAAGPVYLFLIQHEEILKLSNGKKINLSWELVSEDNGWGNFIKDLRIQYVPGDHDTLLEEPNVEELAQKINQVK